MTIVYGLVRGLTSKGSERNLGFVIAVVGAGTMGAGFVITRAQDVAEAELVEEKSGKTSLGAREAKLLALGGGDGGAVLTASTRGVAPRATSARFGRRGIGSKM